MKYSMITSTKCLSFEQNLQWESYTSYTPPTSVMWLQVWHKQTITGTSTSLLQKHIDKCAHNFIHSPDLWHQPRLANITYTLQLCAINPAITHHPEKPSIWTLLFYTTWLKNFSSFDGTQTFIWVYQWCWATRIYSIYIPDRIMYFYLEIL